jgi:hypothetical protein
MDETKSVSELQHPKWNPRLIKDFDFTNLVNSIREFGDLSGVVKNVTTSNLVGGNQRVEAFKKLNTDRIIITQQMDRPTDVGTIAHGYIVMPDGEMFSYREVLWDEWKEKAANIAANHITGEDDKQLLAQVDYDLSQLENGDELLKLTGQTDKEIDKLLKSVGVGDDPEPPADDQQDEAKNEKLTFALSPDQREVVELALAQAKQANDIPHTDLDNINGAALYIICRQYVETATSQNVAEEQATDTPSQTTETPQPDLTGIPADTAA